MILDTSFLIDVMNSDSDALEKVDELESNGHAQKIPAMTLQELFIGIGASDLPKSEREKIEAVIEPRPVLETTEAIARKAGLIDGTLRRDGNRIDIGDATIGATALREDEPVVTGNSEHFERIDGIDVESY
ncbi:type II toxin-antitoxin system VapC family toxin [Haladaptatus sp. T7]|nr:type II toxin-antitoxin system VapC family toxin [Haladaptatus sp. T7]GKZ12329.1 tRNA(fMet)-specific endonuclease VapC [Haladaptatus sp. T7]